MVAAFRSTWSAAYILRLEDVTHGAYLIRRVFFIMVYINKQLVQGLDWKMPIGRFVSMILTHKSMHYSMLLPKRALNGNGK